MMDLTEVSEKEWDARKKRMNIQVTYCNTKRCFYIRGNKEYVNGSLLLYSMLKARTKRHLLEHIECHKTGNVEVTWRVKRTKRNVGYLQNCVAGSIHNAHRDLMDLGIIVWEENAA